MAAQSAKPVQLNPRTLEAFDAYIQGAEMEMERLCTETGRFSGLSRHRSERRRSVEGKWWRSSGLAEAPSKCRAV